MLDLNTTRGIVTVALFAASGMAFIVFIYNLIRLAFIHRKIKKLSTAISELRTMPMDEWEAKWAEFVNKDYAKCNDPHKDEVEEDVKFFKDCRNETIEE